jgi:putative hemolysin
MKAFLWIIFFSVYVEANGTSLYQLNQLEKPIALTNYKGVQISEVLCRKPCLAKTIIDKRLGKKLILPELKGKNPTSLLCESLSGRADIFQDNEKAEISVCVLSDGSFFVAWDMMKLN